MWYIYEKNNEIKHSNFEPNAPYITIERMPPKPKQEGYVSVLKADFDENKVWWELIIDESYRKPVTFEEKTDARITYLEMMGGL